MPTYPITDKKTGKTYQMKWNKPTPPTALDAKQFIFEQEKPSLWKTLNEPLTDLPSRVASKVSEPLYKFGESKTGPLATAARYGGAFTEGVGDVLDSFSSPLSLGLTAVTGGAGAATKFGLGRTAQVLKNVERAAGAGMVGHGGYQMATAEDLPEFGAGLIEAAGGGLAMRGAKPKPQPKSRLGLKSGTYEGQPGIPPRKMLGPKPPPYDPTVPIDAEFSVAPDGSIQPAMGGAPDLAALETGLGDQLGLPPGNGRIFYGEQPGANLRSGGKFRRANISEDLDALENKPPRATKGPKPEYTGAGPLNVNRIIKESPIGEGVKPNETPTATYVFDQPGVGPMFNIKGGPLDKSTVSLSKLKELGIEVPKDRTPLAKPSGRREAELLGKFGGKGDSVFAKVSDADLEFLAKTGDKEAVAEMGRRPGLAEALKRLVGEETGSIKNPFANVKFGSPDPPIEFQDWVGKRQAAALEKNPAVRSTRIEQANTDFFAWMMSKGYLKPNAKGLSSFGPGAPPELITATKNYLTKPNETIKWLADKASISKNFALSSGIPYTGINAHGFNILARTVLGNPREALTAAKYIAYPKSAKTFLDSVNPRNMKWAVEKGLTLTTEGHQMGVVGSTNLAGKAMQGFLKVQGKMFEDPLFQEIIPALKTKHFNSMVDDMMKGGMGREEAGRAAAQFTNNLYGGINWEMMGKSRDVQNFMRTLILAPDWLKTNVGLGNGVAKAMLNPNTPQGKQYAKVARNLIGAYIAADVVNYAAAGRHMWENPPGHALDIAIGESGEGDQKKQRYIRPFGTAADFVRLPFDIAASLVQGDLGQGFRVVKNRASIPLTAIENLRMNQDAFGRPIYGKDVYGRKIPVGKQATGIGREVASVVTPPYVRSIFDYGSGQSNTEQAILGGTEMPVRYNRPPKGAPARRTRRRAGR